MATAKDKITVSKKQRKGPLSSAFSAISLTLSALGYIGLALLLSIIIEWVGMSFWWDIDHARHMFSRELHHLGQNFSASLAGASPAELAILVATYTKSWLSENSIVSYLQGIKMIANHIESALFVCMTVSVRLTIIILSSLIIILVSIITAIDGLVERELRNFGGDLEHSKVVHIALSWAPESAIAAPIIYLAWPGLANPVYFFIPAMMLYGTANYVLFSQYQKRL